ncbi:TPA: magnesium/cobalt transporter CorA [Candidatus Woesearchaeota archaeon]|nr:magnesium/cobalt transporter CorA [Candidatus Woesearchaeota archaeon]
MMDIFYFDKKMRKAAPEQLPKIKNKRLWVDVSNITKQEAEVLRDAFNLHPVTAEDLLNANTRIKVEEFPQYLFCIFYGVEHKKGIELMELDFVIGRNFLISSRNADISSYAELKSNREKLEALFRRGVDFIFHRLLDGEQDNYFPVLEYIDDEIDIIEGKLSGTPSNDLLTSILALKHSISLLRKTTLQQTEKLSFLVKNDYRFLSKHALPYFRDIYDHSIRVSDLIDNYREAIINTFEFYMSAVSKNMNEAVKVLSVIATIALPLTVVSSIYGTNFTNLPGSGFHYGFWVMIGFMIVLSGSLVYFLRRRGWA